MGWVNFDLSTILRHPSIVSNEVLLWSISKLPQPTLFYFIYLFFPRGNGKILRRDFFEERREIFPSCRIFRLATLFIYVRSLRKPETRLMEWRKRNEVSSFYFDLSAYGYFILKFKLLNFNLPINCAQDNIRSGFEVYWFWFLPSQNVREKGKSAFCNRYLLKVFGKVPAYWHSSCHLPNILFRF